MIDTSRTMLYYVDNLNTKNTEISYAMASGKAIKDGSDDSTLYATLNDLEDNLRVTENLNLQLVKSKAINDSADKSVADDKVILEDIKVDLLKSLNDGMDRDDKLALATNMRGMRENLIDQSNTEVDGEYVFSGSDTTKRTLEKDKNYELNGKVNYEGDGFLRKIAVAPDSYRDRGITAYDVNFYTSSKAGANQSFNFSANERVIDENGNEWKLNNDATKLQKYDHNGNLYDPAIELDVSLTSEPTMRVDLGVDANTDANGDYKVTVNGTEYKYSADGDDSAQDILDGLADADGNLLKDDYTVSNLDHNDKFYISSGDDSKLTVSVSDTDDKYNITLSNEIEATDEAQARQATYVIDNIGEEPASRVFEAKHNYFDDLNIIINALEGKVTQLDGTAGPTVDDDIIDETLRTGLDHTSKQYNATNVGHGELGGRNKVFDVAYEKNEAQITNYNILLQEYGGADLTKLSMDSKALELTYSALYSTIAKLNDLTLLKYLN